METCVSAYPYTNEHFQYKLAVDQFIDTQLDLDLLITISERWPMTLQEAVKFPRELESFLAVTYQRKKQPLVKKMEADHQEPCQYRFVSRMHDGKEDSSLVYGIFE